MGIDPDTGGALAALKIEGGFGAWDSTVATRASANMDEGFPSMVRGLVALVSGLCMDMITMDGNTLRVQMGSTAGTSAIISCSTQHDHHFASDPCEVFALSSFSQEDHLRTLVGTSEPRLYDSPCIMTKVGKTVRR